MSTINLRVGNDALTFAELDANFTNLNNDKYESGDDAALRSVTFTNLEKSSTPSGDGALAFDSSQGLLIRRTQQNVTNAVVTVLDGSNVNAGTSINISNLGSGTNGGGTGTEQFTFDHADVTRSDPTAGNNSLSHSGTFAAITGVTTNAQGHVTAVQANNFTLPAGAVPNNGLLDINQGTAISLTITGGDFTADKSTETDIIINHADVTRNANTTSSVSPGYGGSFTAIDSVVTNAQGHVTDVNVKTVNIPASDNTNTDTLQSIADDTTSNNRYISFVDAATGAQTGKSSALLRYKPNEAILAVGNTSVSEVQTSEVSCISNQQLVLNAGEARGTIAAGGVVQNAEIIYMNAENGVQINSSSNNWVDSVNGGWAGTVQTLTLNDSSGNSSFPGNITATGTLGGSNFSGSSSGTNTGDEPDASASVAGIVTTGNQAFAGIKTFQSGVNIGVDDNTSGNLIIYGASSGNEGGEIRLHMTAAHDTTYDFYRIDIESDDFRIGRTGLTDLQILGADGTVDITNEVRAKQVRADQTSTTAAGAADQVLMTGYGIIGNRAAAPVYLHNNDAGGVQIGHGTIGAAGQIALFTDNNVDLTARLDVAYDLRLRGDGTSADIGVASIKTDASNKVILDAGNSGTNLVTIDTNGLFTATSKSFDIEHPTKEGMRLRYGSLEGPENGVYIRGKLQNNKVIELPDYWTGLVDEDTITVSLTPIGSNVVMWVQKVEDNKVYIEAIPSIFECYYHIFAERKDIDKITVEYESGDNL